MMMDRGLDMAPHRLDYYMAQARRHAGSGLFRRVALLAMSACLGPGTVSGTRELFNRFDEVRLCCIILQLLLKARIMDLCKHPRGFMI